MNMNLKFSTVIITCPGREQDLRNTLTSYLLTDMADWPVIQLDTNTCERRQERQERNSLTALELLLKGEADVYLFCEDDLRFNQHLRHNLENWRPLRNWTSGLRPGCVAPSVKEYFFGSLYDPNIRVQQENAAENYFIAEPDSVYGSQCFVLSRAVVEYCVAHWWEVPGMQDIKISRLAARLGPLHYHTPSLVQHVGVKSTWTEDARFHETKMYDPDFRAEART